MTTGFLYSPRFLEHNPGAGHPESKERLVRTMAYLERQPWFTSLERLEPRAAERTWIETTHSPDYVERAREACQVRRPILDTPDVGISEESFDIALLAAGGAMQIADAVMAGKIRNGFALLRPPGHHAENSFAMGFCLFNNAAITARYLQKKHGLERVLILDWDVHHGNGTQHTFEEDPSVLYVSLHQYPFYPGTGSMWETGKGRGEGTTLNCPMRAGSEDAHYQEAFKTKIIPKIDAFRPDAVVLSAGFDAHTDDPLANIDLEAESFGWMTDRVMESAEKYSKGRIISLLEGGYDLNALPACVAEHLTRLAGVSSRPE